MIKQINRSGVDRYVKVANEFADGYCMKARNNVADRKPQNKIQERASERVHSKIVGQKVRSPPISHYTVPPIFSGLFLFSSVSRSVAGAVVFNPSGFFERCLPIYPLEPQR